MDFIQQNILLVVLVIVSGGLLLLSFRRAADELTPVDATMMINREDAIVIDIRTPAEFAVAHIPEARNLPVDKLADTITRLSDDEVHLDEIERLLIELRRAGVVSRAQMIELLGNYLDESHV